MRPSGPKQKLGIIAVVACICLVSFYWVKNSAGINLISDFSLSAYFPFSLLRSENTIYHKRGPVDIDEDFESLLPIPAKWLNLVTPEPGSVKANREKVGGEDSRSLVVTSTGDLWWHVTHRYVLEVEEGDNFIMEAMLWSKSKGGDGQVQISALDKNGRLIKRNMWSIKASSEGKLQEVKKHFTIYPGVALIKLRMAGNGKGVFRFDNVRLTRLE